MILFYYTHVRIVLFYLPHCVIVTVIRICLPLLIEFSTLIHMVVVEQQSQRIDFTQGNICDSTKKCSFMNMSMILYYLLHGYIALRKLGKLNCLPLDITSRGKILSCVVIAARMHPASIPKYTRSPNCIYWQQNWISIWKSLKDTGNENF